MAKSGKKNNVTYVCFLLGINIGSHKRVPMSELKKMFEQMGFLNVRTLLVSGNVIFDSPRKNTLALARELETQIIKTFGFEVSVIIRTLADVKKMIDADPFKKIKITSDIRLYVTFYLEEPKEKITLPYKSSDKEGGTFRIFDISDHVIYSVATLGKSGTTEAMNILRKMFGKKITTRNWNTIKKLYR